MKLLAPDKGANVTVRGINYKPDDEGFIDVPLDQVEEFAPHGFIVPENQPAIPRRAAPRKEPEIDVEDLTRDQMFDLAREAGVRTPVPITNAQLRAICHAIRAGKDTTGMSGVIGEGERRHRPGRPAP